MFYPKQPLFVLSVVSLDDYVAAEFARCVGTEEPELKFSERAREEGQRVRRPTPQRPGDQARTARLSLCHKPVDAEQLAAQLVVMAKIA